MIKQHLSIVHYIFFLQKIKKYAAGIGKFGRSATNTFIFQHSCATSKLIFEVEHNSLMTKFVLIFCVEWFSRNLFPLVFVLIWKVKTEVLDAEKMKGYFLRKQIINRVVKSFSNRFRAGWRSGMSFASGSEGPLLKPP